MSKQRKKLKTWQGWAIFGGAMVFVFCLGLLAASITNRRAEITTIYANKKELNSSSKCNGIHINNLFKFFVWCEVSKSFTRSII